jgi:hypothetical protein
MRKTIINAQTGDVTNVIVLADNSNWMPPEGEMIGPDGGEIGQRWNGTAYEWINPPVSDDAPVDPQGGDANVV